jgi:gluconolactonase
VCVTYPANRNSGRNAFVNWKIAITRGYILAALLLIALHTRTVVNAAHPARDFQLQAESPLFWNLVDPKAKLSLVATGFGFTEGPVWDQKGFV